MLSSSAFTLIVFNCCEIKVVTMTYVCKIYKVHIVLLICFLILNPILEKSCICLQSVQSSSLNIC